MGVRPFRLPDEIGVGELAVFVIARAVLPLWFTERGWSGAAIIAGIDVVVLALAYSRHLAVAGWRLSRRSSGIR